MNNQYSEAFIRRALELNQDDVVQELAEALIVCRGAARDIVELSKDGRVGMIRLMEIWCLLEPPKEDFSVSGSEPSALAKLLGQVLAAMILHPVSGSKGLAICSELSYMAEEILAGGWFE